MASTKWTWPSVLETVIEMAGTKQSEGLSLEREQSYQKTRDLVAGWKYKNLVPPLQNYKK